MTAAVSHLQSSPEIPLQAPQPPLNSCKVSQWFYPQPLVVMTHAFLHSLAHGMG